MGKGLLFCKGCGEPFKPTHDVAGNSVEVCSKECSELAASLEAAEQTTRKQLKRQYGEKIFDVAEGGDAPDGGNFRVVADYAIADSAPPVVTFDDILMATARGDGDDASRMDEGERDQRRGTPSGIPTAAGGGGRWGRLSSWFLEGLDRGRASRVARSATTAPTPEVPTPSPIIETDWARLEEQALAAFEELPSDFRLPSLDDGDEPDDGEGG